MSFGSSLCARSRLLAGFFPVAGEFENQPGMQILEQTVPIRARQLVDGLDRAARPRWRRRTAQPESSVAARSVIGPRTDCRQMRPRRLILLLLDRAHAEREPRDAVGLVVLDNPLRELDGFLDFAACQQREEGAVE